MSARKSKKTGEIIRDMELGKEMKSMAKNHMSLINYVTMFAIALDSQYHVNSVVISIFDVYAITLCYDLAIC